MRYSSTFGSASGSTSESTSGYMSGSTSGSMSGSTSGGTSGRAGGGVRGGQSRVGSAHCSVFRKQCSAFRLFRLAFRSEDGLSAPGNTLLRAEIGGGAEGAAPYFRPVISCSPPARSDHVQI